jgi:hypothetical protein
MNVGGGMTSFNDKASRMGTWVYRERRQWLSAVLDEPVSKTGVLVFGHMVTVLGMTLLVGGEGNR